jgi:site-specific recombinase XerD
MNMLKRQYRPTQRRAGFEGQFGFHALRHAAASAWISQGMDLKRLQVWIGHENIQLTLDTYGHLLVDKEADAALIAKAEADLFG